MKRKIRKPVLLLLALLGLTVFSASSAYAFSDIGADPNKTHIESLQQRGVIHGQGQDKFNPKGTVNAATAVSLIVGGLKLNIDDLHFVKKPKASDYFTKVKDNAWYAKAFVIAQLNGLDIPKDIDPMAAVTREQFAHWLYQAIISRGEYAWIQMFVEIADANKINPPYTDSIQKLLVSKIAELDAKGNFRPTAPITRSEAAAMVDKAIRFVENTKPIPPVPPAVLQNVTLTSEKVADGVLKVTVKGQAPHPGYGLEVSSIVFGGGEAVVYYRVKMPDPDAIYPQIVTEVQAVTYVSADYKPVLGGPDGSDPTPIDASGSSASDAGGR